MHRLMAGKVDWYGSIHPTTEYTIDCSHIWFIPDSVHLPSHTSGIHIDRVCSECGAQQCGIDLYK